MSFKEYVTLYWFMLSVNLLWIISASVWYSTVLLDPIMLWIVALCAAIVVVLDAVVLVDWVEDAVVEEDVALDVVVAGIDVEEVGVTEVVEGFEAVEVVAGIDVEVV